MALTQGGRADRAPCDYLGTAEITARLARDFGASVVSHGGVANQHTLPFGSAEDVPREVAENIRVFRGGKGYVVAPRHNLPSNTPTENVASLYEAVEEFG